MMMRMKNDTFLTTVLQKLAALMPLSVFMYGSHAHGEAHDGSDYELGVVFTDESYINRSAVQAAVAEPNVRAYPFRLSELQAGTFVHPFVKPLFLRDLSTGARTVSGDRVVEKLTPPPITLLDLLMEVRFEIGRLMGALGSLRAGDMPTAQDGFCKASLYGLRCLEIYETKTFPASYNAILKTADICALTDDDIATVKAAASVRRESNTVLTADMMFKALSFLAGRIEPVFLDAFYKRGNEALL